MTRLQLFTPAISEREYEPVTADMFFEDPETPTSLLGEIYNFVSELYESLSHDKQPTLYVVGGIVRSLESDSCARKDLDLVVVPSRRIRDSDRFTIDLTRETTNQFELPVDVYVCSEQEIESSERVNLTELLF